MKKRVPRGDAERQTYWEEVLRRWQERGQTVRAFCRGEGLRESAFYFWRQKLARGERQAGAKDSRGGAIPARPALGVARPVSPRSGGGPAFLPVQVVGPGVSEAARVVEIVLAGGCTVRVPPGFDRRTLADVLAVLETRPC